MVDQNLAEFRLAPFWTTDHSHLLLQWQVINSAELDVNGHRAIFVHGHSVKVMFADDRTVNKNYNSGSVLCRIGIPGQIPKKTTKNPLKLNPILVLCFTYNDTFYYG